MKVVNPDLDCMCTCKSMLMKREKRREEKRKELKRSRAEQYVEVKKAQRRR